MLFPYRDPNTGQFARAVVRNIPHDDSIIFVSDSQDVDAVKDHIGLADEYDYDSFFVVVANGDYTAVWGMVGIVPYLTKPVYRLL